MNELLYMAVGGAVGGLAVWLLKELYGIYKDSNEINKNDIMELKLAIVELKTEMKLTRESMQDLPRVKKDINALHSKVRELAQAQNQ